MIRRIRDYELQERIGKGGFGEVYRALQPAVNREVAIKLILPDFANQPEFRRRFHTEAEVIGKLEHPFIVPLYDFWQDESGAFLVMRWMRGGSLHSRLKQGSSNILMLLRWVEQLASALHVAHRAGVVHRDLKPENILLDEDDNIYLADFGIAKNITPQANPTTENPFTPIYAAPEQFTGEPVTPACDIYSLGIMLYEMLTGTPPFTGSLTEVLFAHLNKPLPSIQGQIPVLSRAIDAVLERATAKIPEERYSDALLLLEAFRAAVQNPGTISPVQPRTTANPFFHRGPIRDAQYFFGRESAVRQVMTLLKNGQSLSIVGQRRIGKTSLLYHMLDTSVLASYDMPTSQYLFVYLDCGTLITLNQPELYRALLEEIEDALRDKSHAPFEFKALESDKPVTYRDFERALRQFFDAGWRLVLILDEFELLSRNANMDTSVFTGLRALAMRYPVTYVTASRQPLVELTYADSSALSSPFFNIFATIRLTLFTESEARTLLLTLSQSATDPFDDAVSGMILWFGGCLPLLLQIAAYHTLALQREIHTPLSQDLVPELRRRFLEEADAHFAYYWRSLSDEEQRLLVLLPIIRDQEQAIARGLEQMSLILRDGDEQYHHFSGAFRDFVIKQPVPGLAHAGEVIIDEVRREAISYGEFLELTPTQYNLLSVFLRQPGKVLANEALEKALWHDEYVEDPERLKAVIKGLRRALGDKSDHIENMRGVGYQWRLTL